MKNKITFTVEIELSMTRGSKGSGPMSYSGPTPDEPDEVEATLTSDAPAFIEEAIGQALNTDAGYDWQHEQFEQHDTGPDTMASIHAITDEARAALKLVGGEQG